MTLLGAFDIITPDPGLFIWTVLVFLILLWLLNKFAFGPIKDALKKREEGISDALHQAQKAREEMANMKADNEKILNEAREERSRMLREAKDAKDQIITEAREKANAEYNRIVDEAKGAINNQKMAALIEIKNNVGNMVLEVSEKILRRELDNKADQEQYIKQLVEEIKVK
ncbi:MAG: F0F1 ATP synthase subunit B [Bacteroidetes bacterium]|nr:F0F1 ATP synthase subunit B [Bacteroidota bacterium]MBK8345024.1 F0F1 ATP synthase subunit B [Bacteroidota bacterium]